MKQINGIWFPDAEVGVKDLVESGPVWNGAGTYQLHKLTPAVEACRLRRVAIDVGGHVGLWSRVLAGLFRSVWAFEPMPPLRECWQKNMEGRANAGLLPFALGAQDGDLWLRYKETNTGNTAALIGHQEGKVGHKAEMRRLDDFHFLEVDFIKIDCEGYEEMVLRGAERTLLRNMPVVIVEQKPGIPEQCGLKKLGGVRYLESLGWRVLWCVGGDYLMLPVGHPKHADLLAHWTKQDARGHPAP